MNPSKVPGRIGLREVAAFARGCAVLGCGGGGGVTLAERLARDAVARFGPVRVVDFDDLAPDAFVMPCGMLGSPLIFEERLPTGDEPAELLAAVQAAHGRRVDALMPFQLAGANGLVPLAWAATVGLPLVDADGTGRPMPNMATVMGLSGVPSTPAFVVDGEGQRITIRAATRERFVTTAFGVLAGVGGLGAFAFELMDASVGRRAAIRGTVSRALAIGRAVLTRRGAVEAALPGGRVLARGRIRHLRHDTPDRGKGGSLLVEDTDGHRLLRVEFQDEFLLALDGGRLVAATPDTIVLFDAETRRPLLIDELREDRFVTVVAGDGPAAWRTPEGLALAGPAAFGLDLPDGVA
ncbi:hypothetical protein BAY59_34850 [Prauserella coralliicola]|nr:hypothetical protein BAY59_34850 [Prauserella coralliicola]